MVGLALAREGFKDVTSIDIDPNVLEELRTRAAQDDLNLKVVSHDLNATPDPSLVRPYSLIFIDPMYSIEGVTLFLDAAKAMTTPDTFPRIFLSVHLMSFNSIGLPRLSELIEDKNYEVCRFHSSFNMYPVPRTLRYLLRIFNRRFMRTNLPVSARLDVSLLSFRCSPSSREPVMTLGDENQELSPIIQGMRDFQGNQSIRHCKIIGTLGPSSSSKETIKALGRDRYGCGTPELLPWRP